MYLGELKQVMKARGIAVDLISLMATPWSTLEGKIPVQRLLRTSLFVPAIRKYDIVHVQFTFPMGFLLSLLKPFHGKPVIIHTHGDDVFAIPSAGIGFRRSGFGRLATKISWGAASEIIAVCKKAKAEIQKAGVRDTKISVLYNGVNESLFCRKKNLEDNQYGSIHEGRDFVFLNVGALKEVKNQVRLITAFSLYLKDSDSHSKLIICGAGHLDGTLRALSRKLNVVDNVVFLGNVPHYRMPLLYSAVDAYIMPSLHEAHPWSILEAMSCELPVVASNVGGIPETINNEKLLTNPWKIDEIRQAMQYLAENPQRSRAIGTQNRKTVLTRFTLKQHASQLESIYAKVSQERQSRGQA
jgi:glycosyltransferase involved in cell wall biosynthesis